MKREISRFVAGAERAVAEGKPVRAEASGAILYELRDRPGSDTGLVARTAGAGSGRFGQATLRGGRSIPKRRD